MGLALPGGNQETEIISGAPSSMEQPRGANVVGNRRTEGPNVADVPGRGSANVSVKGQITSS